MLHREATQSVVNSASTCKSALARKLEYQPTIHEVQGLIRIICTTSAPRLPMRMQNAFSAWYEAGSDVGPKIFTQPSLNNFLPTGIRGLPPLKRWANLLSMAVDGIRGALDRFLYWPAGLL